MQDLTIKSACNTRLLVIRMLAATYHNGYECAPLHL